VFLKGNIFSLF